MTRNSTQDIAIGLAVAGAAAAALLAPAILPKQHDRAARRTLSSRRARQLVPAKAARRLDRAVARSAKYVSPKDGRIAQHAGRRLSGSASLLALSVLADSAVEHYRGSFENRAMFVPLVVSAMTSMAGLFGRLDHRDGRHAGRDAVYLSSALTGMAGFMFHFYNILKRPGGWSWLNLFYAAPIGAPMALTLGGFLGRSGESVRNTSRGKRVALFGLPAGRLLGAATAIGLAGTVGEAGLLHFRGAYHNPAMLLPVTVPPLASLSLAAATLHPTSTTQRLARFWLRLTAVLGLGGVGFHAYGVSRNMGGWRNWSQNVLNGPPLPAPPSFAALALAGLAALTLTEDENNA